MAVRAGPGARQDEGNDMLQFPSKSAATISVAPQFNVLRARQLGIETHDAAIAFLRKDCHVCRAEGFASHARIKITRGRRSVIATLYQITSDLVAPDEVGLSQSAWDRLSLKDGDDVVVNHPPVVESLSAVRGKIYGQPIEQNAALGIIRDVIAGRYSDMHLAAFVSACAARTLQADEVIALTRAMAETGETLTWLTRPIMDKHCIGGLPGNRTTPIVVAIAATFGLIIPKTSSRAITSPAGTADTMETIAPVDLDIASMRRVVDREGGCIVWGKRMRLSPSDDLLICAERALDLDSGGQLIASVLSKKVAAGATHLVLDLPFGATAKIRSLADAERLREMALQVAAAFGIETKVIVSDGSQPVGRRIGPALEAHDVLAVLQGHPDAPADLRDRALALAGALLELGGVVENGGFAMAQAAIADGRAWTKFQRICEAQGGMREPPTAKQWRPVIATTSGKVLRIDNRRLARVAKLAGAPDAKAAGVELHVRVGDLISEREPLFVVHAETRGELAYCMEYLKANPDIIVVDGR
jgi:thymidine phosphorylase